MLKRWIFNRWEFSGIFDASVLSSAPFLSCRVPWFVPKHFHRCWSRPEVWPKTTWPCAGPWSMAWDGRWPCFHRWTSESPVKKTWCCLAFLFFVKQCQNCFVLLVCLLHCLFCLFARLFVCLFVYFPMVLDLCQEHDTACGTSHALSRRWLLNGQLIHAPATAVEASTTVGVALFMDFFSIANALAFLRLLISGGAEIWFIVAHVVSCASWLWLLQYIPIPCLKAGGTRMFQRTSVYDSVRMGGILARIRDCHYLYIPPISPGVQGHDLCLIDDSCLRLAPLMLLRSFGIPSIATTHSDVPSHPLYDQSFMPKVMWWLHLASAFCATSHATVANAYAKSLWDRYKVPVHSVWPPVLWSDTFRRPLRDFTLPAAERRQQWLRRLGFEPRAIFLFAGRWSAEKRIHLLIDSMPEDCGLVIVGDSDADYADEIEAANPSCSRVLKCITWSFWRYISLSKPGQVMSRSYETSQHRFTTSW